jgi:ADP-ribose pyrophosphatase YjhB (NUDIX family)
MTKNYIRNKRLYCSNCGKCGHKYIKCNEPITSIGIIAIQFDDNLSYDKTINLFNEIKTYNIIKSNTISYNLLLEINKYKDKMKFLMIRRKKTLGYIEFIRGRYELNDLLHLTHLFKQMTQDEIDDIIKNEFDTIWKDLWKINAENKYYKSEYNHSKQKFDEFKKNEVMINLCKKINLKYKTPEWGFPKGRRNYLERNTDCAIREFKEETGLLDDDFVILDNISPLCETFHGTNDILYKHIYYIAICKKNINVSVDKNNLIQCEEVGDIGWFKYDKCSDLIRYYHNERQKVLNEVFLFILNLIKHDFKKIMLTNENIFDTSNDTNNILYIDTNKNNINLVIDL